MRLPGRHLSWLCLLLSILASSALADEAPALYRPSDGGRLEPLPLTVLREYPADPARDMVLGFSDEALLLSPEGDLSIIAARDSLARSFLGADLAPEHWPESLAADGTDWLLLVGGGASILRLGRRGEGKEEILLPESAFWRQIRSDRAGRIWVSEGSGDRILVLSRSGQVLLGWRLSQRLSGYRGPLRAWCNDGSGGILLAEGWPARLWRLNGAGNPLGGASPELPPGSLALAVDAAGDAILAIGPEGEELHLARRNMSRELVLKGERRIWILEPGTVDSGAP
jgi:hypothetical protein